MSVSFKINSSFAAYDVHIKSGVFSKMKTYSGDFIVICDDRFHEEFERAGVKVIAIKADEGVKSLSAMPPLIEKMRKLGVSRKTTLIAIGGGIVQDAAAFCASIYMRGIDWLYVPTTLLGMSDSCIGGKSSINVGDFKNLVGGFYPPKAIYIDPLLCRSLSQEQWSSGLIEAAKICFARSPSTFERFLALKSGSQNDEAVLAQTIQLSLETKKWFIEIDEFDKKERLLLNFGHTFGHAIESASGFAISHGIAVGLGCLSALSMAESSGTDLSQQKITHLYEVFIRKCVNLVPDLERHLRALNPEALMEAFESDKKHSGQNYSVVTVDDIGNVVLRSLPKSAESRQLLRKSFVAMLEPFQHKNTLEFAK